MQVYVFPLGHILLYPASAKPLNVFEPRYIQMIHDSVASNIPIAIGFVDEPDREHPYKSGEPLSFVRPIVGFGKPHIVEQRPDGSMVVFLQGAGKARLGKVIDSGKPYIVCEAEELPEIHEVSEKNYGTYLMVQKVLIQWMNTHVLDPQTRAQFITNIRTPEEVVGCYASYMVADHDMQQLILECDDINDKIKLITGLIHSGELV